MLVRGPVLWAGELGHHRTGRQRNRHSALRRWPEVAETGLLSVWLIQVIWEHVLPQARGASAGASAQ